MRTKVKRKIYADLYGPIESWYHDVYEKTEGFTKPIGPDGPVRKFGIRKYDRPRSYRFKKGPKYPVKPQPLKSADLVHFVLFGPHYFLYLRKENILMAVFYWNKEEKKYTCYMTNEIARTLGKRLPNKAYFLYYLVRRALVDVITKHTINVVKVAYEKESQSDYNIIVKYGNLTTIYGFVAPSITREDKRPWQKKLHWATISFMEATSRCPKRARQRANLAAKTLKQHFDF